MSRVAVEYTRIRKLKRGELLKCLKKYQFLTIDGRILIEYVGGMFECEDYGSRSISATDDEATVVAWLRKRGVTSNSKVVVGNDIKEVNSGGSIHFVSSLGGITVKKNKNLTVVVESEDTDVNGNSAKASKKKGGKVQKEEKKKIKKGDKKGKKLKKKMTASANGKLTSSEHIKTTVKKKKASVNPVGQVFSCTYKGKQANMEYGGPKNYKLAGTSKNFSSMSQLVKFAFKKQCEDDQWLAGNLSGKQRWINSSGVALKEMVG